MKIAFHIIGLLRTLDVVRVWAKQDAYFHPRDDVVKITDLIDPSESRSDRMNALNLIPEGTGLPNHVELLRLTLERATTPEYRAELISLSKSLGMLYMKYYNLSCFKL